MNCLIRISLIFFLFPQLVLSQKKEKIKFPFNEVFISINKSPSMSEGQIGYFGFGAGMNRRYRDSNRIGFLLGVHYNYSSQYLDSYQKSRAGVHSDIIYTFHSVTIPIAWRFKFGKSKRIFAELGGNLDLLLPYKKSYIYTSSGFGGGATGISYGEEKVKGFNLSANIGIGTVLSIGKRELIIKLDYKIGAANFGETYWPTQPIHDQYGRISFGYFFNNGLRNNLKSFFKDY